MTDLHQRVRDWIAEDPDPATRAELEGLLSGGDDAGLRGRFGARLQFGTAGIRGPLGAGPGRVNRVVVRRVTAGVAAQLLATVPDSRRRGVVVGHDARHGSAAFAADAAGVLAAAGIPVRLATGPVPTPLVAFATRHLDAAAGVQVTASHNPAADNGYKVYWTGGAQLVAPLDAAISARIDALDAPPPCAAPDDPRIAPLGEDVADAYVRAVLDRLGDGPRELRIVVTFLHGVGRDLALRLFAAAGFRDVHVVAQQADPDPEFPTVAFPNPEEPGALDLALALAREVGADVVLATDPDADRIAVAVPDGAAHDPVWRPLSGDETGCLLAADLLARDPGGPERIVATTVVSSRLLARIAADHDATHVETLTGFKWLAAVSGAAEREVEGGRTLLAYEQALGVMVGTVVRDKDGLGAALAVADLAARERAQGRRLVDAVDDLARRHGLHHTAGRSVRLEGADGPALVERVLTGLRSAPPATVGGVAVTAVADHAVGIRTLADGTVEPVGTPPTDLVGLTLSDGSRVQVRPSGTEPLLKSYAEVVEPVAAGEPVAAARDRADRRVAALLDAFWTVASPP